MEEVEELCSMLTVLDHGSVVFSGTVEELRALAPAAVCAMRTSDDDAALRSAVQRSGIRVFQTPGVGLEVAANLEALDAYVIALGNAGVAVRSLERRARSLESLFLELTGQAAAGNERSTASRVLNGLQTSAVVS